MRHTQQCSGRTSGCAQTPPLAGSGRMLRPAPGQLRASKRPPYRTIALAPRGGLGEHVERDYLGTLNSCFRLLRGGILQIFRDFASVILRIQIQTLKFRLDGACSAGCNTCSTCSRAGLGPQGRSEALPGASRAVVREPSLSTAGCRHSAESSQVLNCLKHSPSKIL